jgi:hypothetical protein
LLLRCSMLDPSDQQQMGHPPDLLLLAQPSPVLLLPALLLLLLMPLATGHRQHLSGDVTCRILLQCNPLDHCCDACCCCCWPAGQQQPQLLHCVADQPTVCCDLYRWYRLQVYCLLLCRPSTASCCCAVPLYRLQIAPRRVTLQNSWCN